MRRFKDVPIFALQPEFSRVCAPKCSTISRTCACVCERANCEGRERKKEVGELWGTHGVAEVGEKGGMSVDEGSRQFCLNHDG